MRILGVDPGSITTGYGVIDSVAGKLQLVEQGAIRTGRGDSLDLRLETIFHALTAVIERSRPEVVAVESPFGGVNTKSLIQLAHARGVILLAARLAGVELFEYSPRSVKSAVVGYGAAEKEQIGHMVNVLLPATRGTKLVEDAADALAVAICHAHSARYAKLSAR